MVRLFDQGRGSAVSFSSSIIAAMKPAAFVRNINRTNRGRERQSNRRNMFESHEFAEKAWERNRLVRTSALSGAPMRRGYRLWYAGRREGPKEQVRFMIGIVLVAHGRLGAEFHAALEHVAGPQKQIESIAIGPDEDVEQRRQDIISAVTKVDDGAGAVVLTDMFGGTPSNLAISVMNGSAVEVIAGVNLAMLIKLASVRKTSSLEQAAIEAHYAARKYMCVASQVLGTKPAQIEHVQQHQYYHIAK
jgi:PTS system mannose-specific IIA component